MSTTYQARRDDEAGDVYIVRLRDAGDGRQVTDAVCGPLRFDNSDLACWSIDMAPTSWIGEWEQADEMWEGEGQ